MSKIGSIRSAISIKHQLLIDGYRAIEYTTQMYRLCVACALRGKMRATQLGICLLYTSDAADE